MTQDKIKTLDGLKDTLSALRKEQKRIVFTNGCFDILHVGHVAYLEEAKKEGDILVVAVNSDDSLKRLKGKGRPVVNQNDRMKMLAALESVDYVVIFKEDNPASIVEDLKPDVIVKGSDWKEDKIIGGESVKKRGGKVITIPISQGYSTTALLEKIKKIQ